MRNPALAHLRDLTTHASGMTIALAFCAGEDPRILVGPIKPSSASAHDVARAAALERDANLPNALLNWAKATPYLQDTVVGDLGPQPSPRRTYGFPHAMDTKAPLAHTRVEWDVEKKGISVVRLAWSLPSRGESPSTQRLLKNQGFKVPAKDPLFLERLFAIFEAIQGPCYVWETFNHVNAATTFKAPDDVASINLLDRLSRAPVALLKGGETALPQALHKIHRLDTGCTVDGTGFPQSLHAILAGS